MKMVVTNAEPGRVEVRIVDESDELPVDPVVSSETAQRIIRGVKVGEEIEVSFA